MSGWDQRHDLDDDNGPGPFERDGRLWWMVAITSLAVIAAAYVWVVL